MKKLNILDYYRKIAEKSRSFRAGRLFGRLADIILLIAAVTVLAVVVLNRVNKNPAKPKRNVITVSRQYENFFGRDTASALIQEFEDHFPDLRIQTAAVSEEAAGEADIIFFDDGEIDELTTASALAPLNPYIHSETQGGQRASQWAIPLVSFMDLFFYNIDILEAAGRDRPPKTRADLLAAARAVAERKTAFPLALGLSQADPLSLRRGLYPWIWADGEIASAAAHLSLTKTSVDVIDFFGQLNREDLLAPGTFEKTSAQRLEEFSEGRIAMLAASSRDIAWLRINAPDLNFGVTAIPQAAQGRNRLGLSGIYAGISGGCALPDEAWTFLAFIAGKSQTLAEALGAVPGGFNKAFPGDYAAKDPLYSKAWDIYEAADIVEYYPADPSEEDLNRLLREKMYAAVD